MQYLGPQIGLGNAATRLWELQQIPDSYEYGEENAKWFYADGPSNFVFCVLPEIIMDTVGSRVLQT